MGRKILFFTDIHWGIHGNNQKYLDICQNTMKWIGSLCIENGIKDIIFGGDFFDSRSTLDIKTMNLATESLYNLVNDTDASVSMILGNHDLYLRDSTSITSLLAYSGNDKIRIIDHVVQDGNIAMIPWGFNLCWDISGDTKYVFCHNDFPKNFFFAFGRGKSKGGDTSTLNSVEELFGINENTIGVIKKNCGTIFSGHIHQKQTIPLTKSSSIEILGSPYETEYGFNGAKCGAFIIDVDGGKYDFVENVANKKHIEVSSSNIDEDLNTLDVCGNFVRLKVDTQEPFTKISEIQQRIIEKKPYHVFNTIFEFSRVAFAGARDQEKNPLEPIEDVNKPSSKLDYILHAIDDADFSLFNYEKGGERKNVDKGMIKNIATEIYEKVCKR